MTTCYVTGCGRVHGLRRDIDLCAYHAADFRAIAALDAEPTEPLEDVVLGWAVLHIANEMDDSSWTAYVEETRHCGKGRYGEGTGSSIDAAIRDAVQNAKGAT